MDQFVTLPPRRKRPDDDPPRYAPDLAAVLRRRIEGEVRFDAGSRALYATDASNYRQVPIGVVIPRSVGDVVETIAACRQYGAPVLPRGGGTSLAGQCCNVAVVLDFTKYLNRVLEIDPQAKTARVEPGCVLDTLRNEAERHHLTFGPDPATHSHNVLGGMIGNNSCGIHSLMAGRTSDNVLSLDVLLYDGTRMKVGPVNDEEYNRVVASGGRIADIYRRCRQLGQDYAVEIRERFPNIPRRVSGYNLPALLPENGLQLAHALVGSEGTLAITLEAATRLVYSPPHRVLLVLGYPTLEQSGDDVPRLLEAKPIGLEGLDEFLMNDLRDKGAHPEDLSLMPEGEAWLLVEFGADTADEARGKAQQLMETLKKSDHPPSMHFFDKPADQEKVWKIRESGLGVTAMVPGKPDTWPGWEDSSVAPEHLGGYLRELRSLFHKHGYHASLYGHFGQGCVHCRIPFDLVTQDGINNYKRFMREAAELVVRFGGSLSGEHGDGQARGELLPIMFGNRLMNAFREFKTIWDPDWKMNPGKVIDANPIDSHLRLGTDYNPPHLATRFQFPEDKRTFSRAALRCVGVGECRRLEGKTMCPSYRATREEMHSTRGRAHLLFEMMQGEVIQDGWRSEEVNEALDLCLSCKGCKGDCPVNVDVAAYKAEFYSHYYEGRVRPRQAYSIGLIDKWAELASKVPRIANFFTQTPGLNTVAKAVAGIHPDRQVPKFALQTLQNWMKRRPRSNHGAPAVMLWPDTLANYFDTDIGRAAVEILEDAGFDVRVPQGHVCCGRPLYDFGMLDRAKGYLVRTLRRFADDIQAGTPIVVLEPSCTSVFRDELTEFFPNSEDARRLKAQTFTLAEFLQQKAAHYQLPQLQAKAMVHGHCHHKAVMKMDADQQVFKRMGLQAEMADTGCCGLAGSFGFETPKYELSMRIGETSVLPAVQSQSRETIIISDGFSCRTQIKQGTGRHALHLAQVLQLAKQQPVERAAAMAATGTYWGLWNKAVVLAAAGLAGFGAAWMAAETQRTTRRR